VTIFSAIRVVIRGGGDLGSGVAYRLYRAGFPALITELEHPLLVRRAVSFGSAVFEQKISVEGVTAHRADSLEEVLEYQLAGVIPVVVDPDGTMLASYQPLVLVDARMLKAAPGPAPVESEFTIGLGPGFSAPENCDAVIETNRGHDLGRVIWQGTAEPDSNIPGKVLDKESQRVLRAPVSGVVRAIASVGAQVKEGEILAEVEGHSLTASFPGVLRGLIPDGTWVPAGMKIGDLDPRAKTRYAFTISDKALAVGGGVLEAILSSRAVVERLQSV